MAPVVTMKQLLESGVHFGHQTRRWNPKMKRFIFTERNGIYIIDLQQSLEYIDRAYEFIKETVAHGGTILYVGTKKQAQEAIAEQARRVGMPFVNQRWLGGMLTNFGTVFKRLQRLKELEEVDFDDVAGSTLTKKELLHLKREHDKLDRSLGGIRHMSRVPSAVWVVDTKKEHIAVSEARKLGIPVIAILDTNCDPDEVTYPIPGNDDAIRSVALLTRVIADAVADGLIARAGLGGDGDEKPSAELGTGEIGTEEPLAEWERELAEGRKTGETAAAANTVNGTAAASTVNGTATATTATTEAAAPADVIDATGASAGAEAGRATTEAAAPADVTAAAPADVTDAAGASAGAEAGGATTEAAAPADVTDAAGASAGAEAGPAASEAGTTEAVTAGASAGAEAGGATTEAAAPADATDATDAAGASAGTEAGGATTEAAAPADATDATGASAGTEAGPAASEAGTTEAATAEATSEAPAEAAPEA
jgi:small subunit ribosomal protein S2